MTISKPSTVAIVGMSCIFPGAPDLAQFWQNIINAVDSVREPDSAEWDARFYRDKASKSFGQIYCSKAGFITEYADFDPLEFGIMPASLRGSDPDQFLALRAASEALEDAGYNHKTFDGERAEIIIGRTMAPGVGSLNLIQHGQTVDQVIEILKAVSPELSADQLDLVAEKLRGGLQPCNPDTIPAVMPNVLSGRIASKLGFRGRNLILDAACASSLIALETAVQGLQSNLSDLAIAGGVHINSSPFFFQMFCELGALSTSGSIKPFDDTADGTVLGEGVGMLVLKRLEDAQRDGNKIYALIRGVGSSSDGRGGTSLAPSEDGEALAMRRAYEMAGISPRSVELYEAHGTATRVGDRVEMKAVQDVFLESNPNDSGLSVHRPWCAIGSVKSMIGHTQAASGIAGVIKAALALHYKVLPPTLHCDKPNSQIDWENSPCYVNSETKEWKSGETNSEPRRAAISAFGFGGVNSHVILEESSKLKPAIAALSSTRKVSKSTVKLLLKYPALSADNLKGLQFQHKASTAATTLKSAPSAIPAGNAPASAQAAAQRQALNANQSFGKAKDSPNSLPQSMANSVSSVALNERLSSRFGQPAASSAANIEGNANQSEQEVIMRAYLQTLGTFQKNMLGVQEQVMMSYLTNESDD